MRDASRACAALAVGLATALWCIGAMAAQYGNDSGANARPILADGTVYTDQFSITSPQAWFMFRVDPNQSYSIEAWTPYGRWNDQYNLAYIWGVYEADGATPVGTVARDFDFPSPQVDSGYTTGSRKTFVNHGAARRLTVYVAKNGPAPPTAHDFALRVVPTTLAAARWSVNGYNDYFAITNVASGPAPVSGAILYFNETGTQVGSDPFSLAGNASTQIVHLDGVAIGGANRGGVRIVHDGAPGAILAHQTLFSPGTGQFIQYPFQALVHAYGRGGI